jgi:DNA-binding transcriptional LysR family regulator
MHDLRSIETFVAVATRGSFRGAASILNTTQPAVSQRIAQLERAVGARLIDRSSRHVRLTEAGREALAYAERILALGVEMRRAAAGRDTVAGTLRLGVSETIVHAWLSAFVARLASVHPGLALEIEVDTTPSLTAALLAQQLDLSFMLGPSAEPAISNLPLARYPLRFLASPALGLPARRLTRDDLTGQTLITFARRTQPYAALRAAFSGPDQIMPRLHACASLAPAVRLASDGVGIAVVPPVVARDAIAAGRLGVLDTDLDLPDLDFVAAFVPGRGSRHAPAVADLARHVAHDHIDQNS